MDGIERRQASAYRIRMEVLINERYYEQRPLKSGLLFYLTQSVIVDLIILFAPAEFAKDKVQW